ncbi:hypothetical protein A9Q79_02705 [Methylophaga sp. 42_25_T18]|nr:hypothetical protein A9Q79_02705 [Methylophaga sp. 42_25_T18]
MPSIEHAWLESQQGLFSFIRSKVAQPEDAEDILSDVFTKLLKRADGNTLPDNITAWLFLVSKNSIVDYYRSKKQFESLPDDIVLEDENNLGDELASCLLPMIKALPEEYQQVLILSELEGKKHKEVAKILDLSLSAVKTRVLRGRTKLKQSILRCCTLTYNKAGSFVDYEQKMADPTDDCGC